jgi:flagellar protein FlgJ
MDVSAITNQASSAASLAGAASHPDRLSRLPKDQQIKAVSGQFEAIMLRQLLQDSVSKVMGGDSGGASGSVYGYLMTDVLANKLSESGGLGLSAMLQKQLTPHTNAVPGPAMGSPNP